MVIICTEKFKKGFFSEYMNIKSFSLLPLLDDSFIFYQLKNFSGFDIDRVFVETDDCDEKKINNGIFEVEFLKTANILKEFLKMNKYTKVVAFKNNCYFEISENTFKLQDGEFAIKCNNYEDVILGISDIENVIKYISANESLDSLYMGYETKLNADFYCKKIENHMDYTALINDIISGKCTYHPPLVAEKIYTDSAIPEGNYTIIPPVFIKSGVQIESGAVIGPSTVLMNDVVIGKNSVIYNSVCLSDVYISSCCFSDGALICENAVIKRNSAVFKGSIIGYDSILGENFILDNNSAIKPLTKTDESVKKAFFVDREENDYLFGFSDLTPEKAAILGCSIGSCFNGERVGISGDGECNSLSVKLALLSGLIAVGAHSTDFGTMNKSRIFFHSVFCNLDYCIYVNCGAEGTGISIYKKDFSSISKADYYNILNVAKQKKFAFCNEGNCSKVKQIKGLNRMYLREIGALFHSPLKFKIKCITDNCLVKKTVKDIITFVGEAPQIKDDITVSFNGDATKAALKCGNMKISHLMLLRIFHYFRREYWELFSDCDNKIIDLCYVDGVFLAFFVIAVLNEIDNSVFEVLEKIPKYFICERKIHPSSKSSNFSKLPDIGFDFYFKDNSLFLRKGNSKAKIHKNADGRDTVITVKSTDLTAAEEFANEIEALL